jgi:hypothetical protein
LLQEDERGLKLTNKPRIMELVDKLAEIQEGSPALTDKKLLSATWRLAWTTEKETLWIVQNAKLFGTQGDQGNDGYGSCAVWQQQLCVGPPLPDDGTSIRRAWRCSTTASPDLPPLLCLQPVMCTRLFHWKRRRTHCCRM